MTKQQRLVLLISILASFVAFLDSSVITVGLPALAEELGGGLTVQQWVLDAYLITLGALMLLAGSLSDIFGRKKILLFGLVGFGATSLLSAMAPTAEILIFLRALQGVAGALLVPSSLALIISTFPPKHQGKAIGHWTAWTGVAMVIGPLLGGFLVDIGSWRWIFLINLGPIALTLWLLRSLKTHHTTRLSLKNLDIAGAALGVIALGGPVFALIEQSRLGWSHPAVFLSLSFGILAFILFIWREQSTPHPMLPLSLFKKRNFSVGNIATAAIYGGLTVATFLITVFVQEIGNFTALQAGFALLPVSILMLLLSSYFGSLASRFGPRWFMSLGPIIAAAGFLSLLAVDQNIHYWTQLLPGILLFGLGLAITVAPLTTAVLSAIDKHHSGVASAVNNTVSRVAGLVAIASIGVVIGPTLNLEGFHRGCILIATLLTIGGLISAIGIRNPKHSDQQ